jgi:tetratricopeptide (TPR) repeat protein
VIVVDDASTDDSVAVADRLAAADASVRVVHRAVNGGPGAARNTGLRAARGRYVCFLDADDEHAPGFLSAAVSVLDADPTIAGLVTGVELIECHRPVDPVQLAAVVRSIPTNLLIRRAVVELLGGFSEAAGFRGPFGGEDIAFRGALARHFRLAQTDHPFLRYRVRSGSHLDKFLDRSAVIDGQLVFTRPTPQEASGAFSTALAEYLDRVRDRVEALVAVGGPGPFGFSEPLGAEPGDSRTVARRCAITAPVPSDHPADQPLTVRTPPARPAPEPAEGDPLALIQAGVALAQQGRLDDALPLLERAVRIAPNHPQARLNFGAALAASGRPAEAAGQLREAVRLKPDYVEAHFNLGNVLRDARRTTEAIDHFRAAIGFRPDHAGAITNLALALTSARRPAEAVPLLQHAARLDPSAKETHNNLGLALADLGRFAEAEAAFGRALELDPRFADALSNLAGVHHELGRMDEALGYYDLALGFAPEASSIRYNRSLALLKNGDYDRGWTEYEWRWRRGTESDRAYPGPRWDGSALDGRTVLVWTEQGLGDVIQFVRYVPFVRARGGRVVVECPVRLQPLIATCPGVDVVVTEGEPLPAYDCQIPLMSLPGLFRTTPQTVPWNGPYVAADPQRVATWGRRLGPESGFKLGLAWQGNPHYRLDRFRSAPLAAFAPLAEVPGVRLFGLQVGPGAAQIASVGPRFRVVDLKPDPDPRSGAFLDAVAILAHLDLVVTIDSAVAHLAGALGVPVWVALSGVSDWRWGVGRSDTPWYPTMRLFRQRTLGDWTEVFEQMAGELAHGAGPPGGCAVPVEIAPGEVLDKITILELKAARLTDPEQLAHVRAELAALESARAARVPAVAGLAGLVRELAEVNAAIWAVEEELRAFERAGEFGPEFVAAARAVYRNNDRRAAVKRRINERVGARFVEQKSYPLDTAAQGPAGAAGVGPGVTGSPEPE